VSKIAEKAAGSL